MFVVLKDQLWKHHCVEVRWEPLLDNSWGARGEALRSIFQHFRYSKFVEQFILDALGSGQDCSWGEGRTGVDHCHSSKAGEQQQGYWRGSGWLGLRADPLISPHSLVLPQHPPLAIPRTNFFQPSALLGFCAQAASASGGNQIPVPTGSRTTSAGLSYSLAVLSRILTTFHFQRPKQLRPTLAAFPKPLLILSYQLCSCLRRKSSLHP